MFKKLTRRRLFIGIGGLLGLMVLCCGGSLLFAPDPTPTPESDGRSQGIDVIEADAATITPAATNTPVPTEPPPTETNPPPTNTPAPTETSPPPTNTSAPTAIPPTAPPPTAVPPTSPPPTAVPPTAIPPTAPPPTEPPPVENPTGCVDINRASFDDLKRIIHIDDDRAQQIINLRPFSSVNSLTRVKGIGDSRLAEIVEQGLACVLP